MTLPLFQKQKRHKQRIKSGFRKNKLKILCIADHVDPLIYSSGIKKRYGDIDLIISAGDLDLSYYGYIVSSLNKPLLFVFGNHNLSHIGDFRPQYRLSPAEKNALGIIPVANGATYIGDKIIHTRGLLIGGLGGSYKYNDGKNQFSEIGMLFKILKILPRLIINRIFKGRWLDILVSHAPPYGINDKSDRCHRGFKIFLLFLKLFKPQYHLHGHIHLYDRNDERVQIYRNTKIINVYDNYIVEVNC